jgi:hypothetical protein
MRNEPGARLHFLVDYIDYILSLHSFILQLPPDPSTTAMRTNFYLKLTLDLFERCIAYPLAQSGGTSPRRNEEDQSLDSLLDCFIQFDEGWFAILTSRAWDTNQNTAVLTNTPRAGWRGDLDVTTRTVLHSTILSGMGAVDRWLCDHLDLERADIREKFGETFWKTLEILEGVEEGTEEFADSESGIPSVSEMEVDEEPDPGMFHGFDDL